MNMQLNARHVLCSNQTDGRSWVRVFVKKITMERNKISSRFLPMESVLPMDSKNSCPDAHTTKSDVHLKSTATMSVYVNRKLLTFPEKLMDIIDSEVFRDAMAWIPDGKAFYITPKVFVDRILNTHFQGSRFGSFQKKLLRYGFHKRNCNMIYLSEGNQNYSNTSLAESRENLMRRPGDLLLDLLRSCTALPTSNSPTGTHKMIRTQTTSCTELIVIWPNFTK